MNVFCPNSEDHRRTASLSNCAIAVLNSSAQPPYRDMNAGIASAWVKFNPPRPANRNFRPTDGMASNNWTSYPSLDSTSAAINPAGPPPMMATLTAGDWTGAGSETGSFMKLFTVRSRQPQKTVSVTISSTLTVPPAHQPQPQQDLKWPVT